eukprot:g5603.t1 g5603   contig2:895371-896182(-)
MVNRTHHSHFVALATMLVAFFAVHLASADVEAGLQSEATQPTLEILAEFKDVQSDRDLKWGGSNSRWTTSKAGKGGKGSKPFGASKSSKMQTYPPTTYIPTYMPTYLPTYMPSVFPTEEAMRVHPDRPKCTPQEKEQCCRQVAINAANAGLKCKQLGCNKNQCRENSKPKKKSVPTKREERKQNSDKKRGENTGKREDKKQISNAKRVKDDNNKTTTTTSERRESKDRELREMQIKAE